MYCRNYTGTVGLVLGREVYYSVSYLGEFPIRGPTVSRQRLTEVQYFSNLTLFTVDILLE